MHFFGNTLCLYLNWCNTVPDTIDFGQTAISPIKETVFIVGKIITHSIFKDIRASWLLSKVRKQPQRFAIFMANQIGVQVFFILITLIVMILVVVRPVHKPLLWSFGQAAVTCKYLPCGWVCLRISTDWVFEFWLELVGALCITHWGKTYFLSRNSLDFDF